tara:strand:- start:1182 stop:1352 length:171 start_codon:yes stop_codon:yes gene_type:complete
MKTIQEIESEITQVREEIEATESRDTRKMLISDRQELVNERELILRVGLRSRGSWV